MICDAKERDRQQARERYAKRVAEGRCTQCGAERKPGCTMCPKCLDRKAARQARRVARLGELGVDRHAPIRCEVCLREKPVVPGGMCGKCCEALANAQLGERNAWRQKDVSDGLRLQLRPGERKLYERMAGGGQQVLKFMPAAETTVGEYEIPVCDTAFLREALR